MDNEKFIDTMIITGLLKGNEIKIIKELKGSTINLSELYKIITKFIRDNKIIIKDRLWTVISILNTILCSKYLNEDKIDFTKHILEIYKLKYSDKYLRSVEHLIQELLKINDSGISKGEVELGDLRVVTTLGDISYRNKVIKASYRDNSVTGIGFLIVESIGTIYGCMIRDNNEIFLKRNDLNSFIDTLIKDKYDLMIIPHWSNYSKKLILNKYDTTNLNNCEYLRYLRIFSDKYNLFKSDSKSLKLIKESEYDFKNILKAYIIDGNIWLPAMNDIVDMVYAYPNKSIINEKLEIIASLLSKLKNVLMKDNEIITNKWTLDEYIAKLKYVTERYRGG